MNYLYIIALVSSVCVCTINAESRYNPDLENQYHLFTRRNPTVSQPLLRGNADILVTTNYDPRLRTIISIHGWNGGVLDDYNLVTIPAYLASDDVNVIVVDWHGGSILDFDMVVESGRSVAAFISWLKFLTGRPAEDFHVIGFSLGSHHAGITSRYVEGGIGYVTALDPSQGRDGNEHIFNADDGLYTEAIYTNAGGVAHVGNLAHANFYPNGGENMPGCNFDLGCNHFRAYFYFAEAIVNGGFTGTECASVADANAGTCNLDGRHQMGSKLPSVGTTGTFYLQTNAGPPFSIY